jgi:hypothetical protein
VYALQGVQLSRTNGRGLITHPHARRPADRIASLLAIRTRALRPRVLIIRASAPGAGRARLQGLPVRVRAWPWWPQRGGPTRSLPEHGRETPQRPRYCAGNGVGQSAGARAALDSRLLNLLSFTTKRRGMEQW